jgi:hypothetical protein
MYLRLLTIVSSLATVLLLSACTEQIKQSRINTIKTFASAVTCDLLDKNPSTMENSMNRIFSFELNDTIRQKLMAKRELPETGLSMMKVVQDELDDKMSNSVHISKVQIVGSVDKQLIPISVFGTDTILKKGQVLQTNPFVIKMVISLPPDESDNPSVVDITEGVPQHIKIAARHYLRHS